jgi:dihydropteroate synthase
MQALEKSWEHSLTLLTALGTHEASKRDVNVAILREVSAGVFKSAILEGTRPEQRFTPDLPSNLPSGIVVVVDQGQAVPKVCSHRFNK